MTTVTMITTAAMRAVVFMCVEELNSYNNHLTIKVALSYMLHKDP